MVYGMIKHRYKPVLANKEPWMQENGLNKFHTITSEVASYFGNPVDWGVIIIYCYYFDIISRLIIFQA